MGVVFTAFAVSLARQLVPKGRENSVVSAVCGALMILALLRPLATINANEAALPAFNLAERAASQRETYSFEQEKALETIIAEKLEAYIWDKAVGLGMDCAVRVQLSRAESGIPVPESVSIGTAYHPILAVWIEEVVGIPAEKQIWQEGNTWTTERESAY